MKSIEDGIYTLVEDKSQLMYVMYRDEEIDHSYHEVITHATANLIRMYFDFNISIAVDTKDGQIELEEYVLDANKFTMIDLRNKDADVIDEYKKLEKLTNLYVLDAIEEDISNM